MGSHVTESSTKRDNFVELLNELAEETVRHGPPPSERAADCDQDMLESPSAPRPRSKTPISKDAIALIRAAEVSSEATYNAKYTHPIWPGGNSGVTIGIGYDIGTVSAALLVQDWRSELDAAVVKRLSSSCGVLGPSAASFLPKFRDITISYATADQVFLNSSVPQFVAHTERALENTALLNPNGLGALVSLTYNRGASFNKDGDRYREMRAIRDHMADHRFDLIPGELRSMKRLWAGDPNLRGLVLRREAEAVLFERGLAADPSLESVAGISDEVETAIPAPVGAEGLEGVFSWVSGWLRPVIEEPTRNHVMFQLPWSGSDEDPIERDANYVAVRVLSARIVNARRWTSLYHGAVHATSSMLYEGVGQSRIERQAVLAPDGFRDIDSKGQGKLLQVDRSLFGPIPYRGDLRLSVALFSVKSSDLAGPYLSLISDLSQSVSSGYVSAALPFIAPIKKASDLLFGTADTASLECGVVRGFEPLKPGAWVSIGGTREDIGPTDGFRLDPQDFRLLDGSGQTFDGYPYLVFEIVKLTERDDWMEIPAVKSAWDDLTTALGAGKLDDAKTAAVTFRHLCLASGDLTESDGARLIAKAARKLALAQGGLETPSFGSLRALDLYGADEESRVPLDDDAHVDPEELSPPVPSNVLEALLPWRVAKALLELRKQVNAGAPNRSTTSDGMIGDAAHAARNSDHNPWIIDGGIGVVSAMDLTNDPAGGLDADALAETLRAARDPRIKYVIWDSRIFSSTVAPWTWRPYNGANPHNKHIHISVRADKAHYDDATAWTI